MITKIWPLLIDWLAKKTLEGIAPSTDRTVSLARQKPSFYGKWYLLLIPLFTVVYQLPFIELQKDDCTINSVMELLYFSAVTITTLGYGDITPENLPAMLLTGAHSVIGITLIGLFLNALSHQHAAESQEEERKVMRKELREELVVDFERIAKEVKESSEELVNQVTGGDSYPVFEPYFTKEGINLEQSSFVIRGDYPLLNVKVDIRPIKSDCRVFGNHDLETLLPELRSLLRIKETYLIENSFKLEVNFITRNSFFIQIINIERGDNGFSYDFNIRKFSHKGAKKEYGYVFRSGHQNMGFYGGVDSTVIDGDCVNK